MPAPSEPRWLARALSVFTPVRQGEAVTALLLTLSLFLLLCAYYIIKPVREALILASESGAEYKAYMSGVIAFTLIFTVSAYGRLVDRLPRRQLMVGVSRFFALNLIVFLLVARIEALAFIVGLGFFVWVGVFNMMVISQFWSFANDLYAVEQGKRLFPLIAIGGSVGSVVGAGLTALLVPVLGTMWMLVFAAMLLWICAWLFAVVDRRDEKKEPALELAATGVPTREATALTRAFKMVVTERYLIAMALFALIFSLANTNSEYILSKLVKAAATEAVASGQIDAGKMGDYIGATYGAFFFYVNLLTFLLQAFVVSRIVRYVGLGAALFFLPVIALGNSAFVFFVPVLAAFRIGKTAENATDYSLNNTLRQMLWLVTNREEKYKAKQAVDTFFVRMGDVGSAILVGVGVLLHLTVPSFALVNTILVVVWIVIMVFVVREYRHRQALLEQAARAEGVAA